MTHLQHRLRRAWQSRSLLACLMWPLTALYGLLIHLRRLAYRWGWLTSTRLPVPVIVVGNVVAGGAGKTPTTLAIASHLENRGWRCGIISRGYGRKQLDARLEVTPTSDAHSVGDEPLLIAQRSQLPVFVARKRVDAGLALLQAYPKVTLLLCDDGLQHWALARDVEIVVFDGRGIGNGWLLPAGPLRECWPYRPHVQAGNPPVQLVLQTESTDTLALPNATSLHTGRRSLAHWAIRADGTRVELAALQHQPVAAVAAIARPEAFFGMLRAEGLTLAHTQALPDHADFEGWSPPNHQSVPWLCTEKDAVKLWQHAPHVLAVPLMLDIDAAFFDDLDRALVAQGYDGPIRGTSSSI